MPRFGQAFNEHCEQNFQDTLQLKQRFLDAKAKRVPKNKDRKQESIQSSVHVQQKFLKRSSEESDPSISGDNFEPPVKLQCTTQQHGSHQNEGLTKFSVEIVQQLEFTTSAANSQPQQISTNVTVKAHTNASVKSDVVSSPKSSNPSTPASSSSNLQPKSNQIGLDVVGTLVECVKQEPDNDFADLDQCAAALEKDAAANGGTGFGGFSDLIGEDTNDEIITSDAFNDLISDISNYPELMKDFDFEDKSENNSASVNGLKVEDIKDIQQENTKQSPLISTQNNYSPPVFDNQTGIKNRMQPYSNIDFCKTELSPAAQTLKQMAEQHQHKNQMGISFNPSTRTPNSRSPYPDFQFQGDYGSPNSNTNFHKNSPNFTQPDLIKQEMIFQGNDYDMKRKGATGIYKQQQYSPYSSPSASSHGSPGYLPRNTTGTTSGTGPFGGGTPPRPSSGPGGNNSGPTLQINQAQQLHISQQNHGHAIQVSAGQHLHLSGDLKGNVSIATQQGMHFNQHTSTNGTTQSQNTQNVPQQTPLSSSSSSSNQQQNPQMHQNNTQQQQQQQNSGNNTHLGTPMMSGNQSGGGMGGIQTNMGPNSNIQNMMGNSNMQHPGNITNLSNQMAETYSMSQTQTINFTQQTLRQRANAPNNMGPNGPMGPGPMSGQSGMVGGPRLMNTQTLEQQKLLQQQQQMLRAQQAALQQHMGRPPPPDYKTSAGMMQGVQPRFSGAPSIRRMPHQPMPPSGPMIRPHNVYMMQQQQQQQQQHIMTRNMYPRQQGPLSGMETMQHGGNEWRHLLMQQQNNNFNPQMRPNMQQGLGFNMNTGNMQIPQHPQMRSQQQVMSQGGGSPMSQMNNMNQMLSHMQQQQQTMMQQQSPQMSISNISSIHMQQTQSMSVTNQSIQQQQQPMNNQLVNNPSNQNNSLNNFNSQNTDFIGLEFLDNLPTTDSTAFTDQELLNSFDSDSGFNLDF